MRPLLLSALFAALLCSPVFAEETKTVRVGIIGLDTSHAPAFTRLFNEPNDDPELSGFRVVAAYPYGSRDIESSFSRIPKYTETVKELGVEITDSIDELLDKVDVVLLETNDGKPHLEQALKVFAAGKPVFIDKPVAAQFADVLAIYQAAEDAGVPMFSSSSLRYNSTAQAARRGDFGAVMGCDTHSPCSLESSHIDFYWYGIHGCEMLFTCMGVGCETVTCTSSADQDIAVGTWSDGRVGTFRGMRTGKLGYGGYAFCEKKAHPLGPHEGYKPLILEIAKFFRSGKPPIDAAETIELYAFMTAAQESKRNGGKPVAIADVIEKAKTESVKLLNR
ncbi:MAG: Gfo/Idh/MocA family oxidoreductase [Planctomycetota bacterium]